MPGLLTQSPAKIIRQELVRSGLGTDPDLRPLQAWPCYAINEPDTPDSTITVYDTTGVVRGRDAPTGEVDEWYGIQVRVRAAAHSAGWAKINAIAVHLDQNVVHERVRIGSTYFDIWTVRRTSTVMSLGPESPTSSRRLFTLNALASIRQV